jgi:hypothetical protein
MLFVNKQGGNAKIVKIEEFNDEQGVYSGEENLFVMTRMEDTLDNTATPLSANNLNKANFKDSDHIEFKVTSNEIPETQNNQLNGVSTFKLFCTSGGDVWLVMPQGQGNNINLTALSDRVAALEDEINTIKGLKINGADDLSGTMEKLDNIFTGVTKIKVLASEINVEG